METCTERNGTRFLARRAGQRQPTRLLLCDFLGDFFGDFLGDFRDEGVDALRRPY
jgi:hypothetical protein